jgi:hypothetical protein
MVGCFGTRPLVEVGLGGCIVGSVVEGCGGLGYDIQVESSHFYPLLVICVRSCIPFHLCI